MVSTMNEKTYFETHESWVTNLPSGWFERKLKYLVDHNTEVLDEMTDPDFEFNYVEIGDVDLTSGIQLKEKIRFEESPSRARRVLRKDDVVISTVRTYLKAITRIPEIPNLIGSTGFCVLRLGKDKLDPGYLYYSIVSDWFVERTISESEGVSYPAINSSDLVELKVIVPPLQEQQLISRYLDKKTKQIDSLIEKIQKKIELLKEQRTSLINQCVTKGLDPNVEMKDSGVEWIGEIPSHWICKKLKYISKITYGISPQETTYNDEGVGTVLINGPVEYSTKDFGYTRSIKWTTDPKNIVPKGSLLFCVRGSTTGRMNICHQDVSIGRGVCSIESNLDQDFTVYSMMMIRIYIQDQISGSTFPSVVKEDVDNFVLPCPSIEEQRSISKFLKEEVEGIDKQINLHLKKNDTLKEYRQSLISSVVTGKVRVTEDMI